MFETLTEKLQRAFKNLRGQGKLTEEHLDTALGEIRESLLDADVNLGVADEFIAHVRAKALGSEVLLQLSPDQQSRENRSRRARRSPRPRSASRSFRLAPAFRLAHRRTARFRQDHFHRQARQMARRTRPSPDRRFHRRLPPRRPRTACASRESHGHSDLAGRGNRQAARNRPRRDARSETLRLRRDPRGYGRPPAH